MRAACIGFLIGVCLLQQQAQLPGPLLLAVLLAIVLLMIWYLRHKRPEFWRGILLMLSGALSGFIWAALCGAWSLREELPKAWENRDLQLVGVVSDLPQRVDGGWRFQFDVGQVVANDLTPLEQARFPRKISLSWYVKNSAVPVTLQPGQRWRLQVRLKRPHGNANPHGFDYEVWLLEQGIRATGSVRASEAVNQMLEPDVAGMAYWIARIRGGLRDRIHTALAGKPYAGVIVALVIGEQREISQSDWNVFSRTGISHLVSISGMHITMIAGLFAGIMSWLWRRSCFIGHDWPLYIPAQKVAALTGAVVACIYVLLAGFGVPAQRTMYMLLVVALAIWSGRISSFSYVLSMALWLVLLLDPWAVLWPGFWLSFGAVALILYAATHDKTSLAGSGRTSLWQQIRQAAHTQYVVTIGLVPLTMLLFGQISVISPVANALAIPVISFFVTPFALLGSVLPGVVGTLLLNGAEMLTGWLAYALQIMSASPLAVWSAATPDLVLVLLAVSGICWLLAPKAWPLRWLGGLCCLPLLVGQASAVAVGELRVHAFDVGQGMAVLLETAGHRLLYDTGPAYSPESDAGNRVVLPFLKAKGIHSLDRVVISHRDSDHAGGAASLFAQLQVTDVYSSLDDTDVVVPPAITHVRCQAGQAWEWEGVRFEMLHPLAVSYESTKWKPNARSCTLKVSTANDSLLLPGDIEAIQEDELINSIPEQLRSTVLLAPHHGSGTSSTPEFLRTVQPQWAIFQVGYLNRYHHPKPEIFSRYADFGINRLRTDESGAITLHFGASLQISEFRREHHRYWYPD
jgi:competence protein ComEC